MQPKILPTINYKPTDIPVTPNDRAMRLTHTNQSIDYNLGHIEDKSGHAPALLTSVNKMATVDPGMAKQAHQKIVAHMTKVLSTIKQGAPTNMKPQMGTIRSPRMASPKASTPKIRTTGSFQGKSNKLGGGGRFKQIVASGKSPALAAYIGRRKYGAKAMGKMSAAARKG